MKLEDIVKKPHISIEILSRADIKPEDLNKRPISIPRGTLIRESGKLISHIQNPLAKGIAQWIADGILNADVDVFVRYDVRYELMIPHQEQKRHAGIVRFLLTDKEI